MRRRRAGLLVALAVAIYLLVHWLLGLFGGGAVEVDRPGPPEPANPPQAGTDDPGEPLRAPPVVRGSFTDPDGEPIAGAGIRIVSLANGQRIETESETDERGRFELPDAPRGKVIFVEAIRRDWPAVRMRPEDAHVRSGRPLELDLAVPDRLDLAGFVKEYAGPNLAGARVVFAQWSTRTDEQGRFRLEDVDSRILKGGARPLLRVRHEGHEDVDLDLRLDTPQARYDDIQVVMERAR